MTNQAHAPLSRAHLGRLRKYFTGGRSAWYYNADAIDLDLYSLGLIEEQGGGDTLRSAVVHVQLTQSGIAALHAAKQEEITRRSAHNTLASRLAYWLRRNGRMTWENTEFRNKDEGYNQIFRPDVFSIEMTLNADNLKPAVHEVKVSRADFLSDIAKPEKMAGYSKISTHFYFACSDGLIKESEIPERAGLVYETTPFEFIVVKKAKKNKISLEPHHYLNLIIKPGVKPEYD